MTNTAIPNDALLKIARVGVIVGRILLGLVGVIMIVGLGIVLFGAERDFAEFGFELASQDIAISPRVAMGIICTIVLILILLSERILQQLQRIIESVGIGDPFIPANADRLARMAWLLLTSQLVALSATTVTVFERMSDDWDFSADWSVEGLFAVLLLFILARVFRHGAEMREDLEGTV